jgi:DNA polymerase III alpha subunit
MAAFLTNEPEDRKQDAIALAKRYGFKIKDLNINLSSVEWEVADDKTLIQPLSSVKGVGDAAIQEIVRCRPFKNIEDLLFREGMSYSKVNKKVLDALCRSGGLSDLVDDRFTGLKHFWSAVIVDRPKTPKKFLENVEKYKPEGDFTQDEKLEFTIALTGTFPIASILNERILEKLEEKNILPISQLEEKSGLVWIVPRKIHEKASKNGRIFWVVEVTDSSGAISEVKMFGVNKKKDILYQNKPYLCKVEKDRWGYSVRGFENVRMLA